jgi:hypothetical protein
MKLNKNVIKKIKLEYVDIILRINRDKLDFLIT